MVPSSEAESPRNCGGLNYLFLCPVRLTGGCFQPGHRGRGGCRASGPACTCLLVLSLLGAQIIQGEKTQPSKQQEVSNNCAWNVPKPPGNPPSLFQVPRAVEAPPLPQLTGSAPVLHPVVAVEGEHAQVCQHVVNGRVHLWGGDVLGPHPWAPGWAGMVPQGCSLLSRCPWGRGECPAVEKGKPQMERKGSEERSIPGREGKTPGGGKGSKPRMGEGSISGGHRGSIPGSLGL